MKSLKILFSIVFLVSTGVSMANASEVRKSILSKVSEATESLECSNEEIQELSRSLTQEEFEYIIDNQSNEKDLQLLTSLQFQCLKAAMAKIKEDYGTPGERIELSLDPDKDMFAYPEYEEFEEAEEPVEEEEQES